MHVTHSMLRPVESVATVRLIVTASSWKVLCIVCVTVPLSFMVLLYFGCEPSESADEWGEQQLKDVKTYLQGIRSDHDHVHKLKTDMDYLRRSMQQEEMVCLERAETGFRSCGQEGRESATCTPAAAANCTGQEFSNIFTFQVRELKRAAEHIERLKTRLLEIPSQHPSAVKPFAPAVFDRTTLTCDWNDEDKIVFAERPESEELSGSSTPYHRMSQEHDELRGCHLKIDSISMSSLAHSRGRKGAPHRIVDEAEEDRFGCFRANREPQGCHKYVKRKVDRLRFKAGCASGVREWGWCGRTPFSFLLPDGFPFGNFDDDNRCTTLGDACSRCASPALVAKHVVRSMGSPAVLGCGAQCTSDGRRAIRRWWRTRRSVPAAWLTRWTTRPAWRSVAGGMCGMASHAASSPR